MRRLGWSVVTLLCACGPEFPAPGGMANGSFLFPSSSSSGAVTLDALSIDSRAGVIAVGTTRDLRLLIGAKGEGFSEPVTVELTPARAAEVNGVVVSDDGARVYAGYSDGLAVVDTALAAPVGRLPLAAPVARLYRDGTTLIAVSFDNVLTTVSIAQPDEAQVQGYLALPGGGGTVRSASIVDHRVTLSAEGVVWVVDASDPTALTLVARHEVEGFVGWSARGPAHLFTGNTGALSVLAMPDDATLTPAGPQGAEWRVPGNAPVLDGARLYLFDDQRGFLYVVDVSSPTQPRRLTYLRPPVDALSCAHPRASVLDADQVLWVACAGGAANYVIDY